MTVREAAIVSAYTGYLIGTFSEMHKYAEELFGKEIYTHEFGNSEFAEELRKKSKKDFISMKVKN